MVFFDYLEAPYRERSRSRTDRHGQPRLVIRDLDPRTGRAELERVFPQPEGPGKGAFARDPSRDRDRRRLQPHPRRAHGPRGHRRAGALRLDDAQLRGHPRSRAGGRLHAGLQQLHRRRLPRRGAGGSSRWASSRWPTSARPCGRSAAASRSSGMIGVHLPPSVPVPHPAAPDAFPAVRLPKHVCHPDFHPVLAAAVELDVAVGVHGSPGVYLPSGIAEQVDTFILSHIFGHRNQMQMALATCVFEGAVRSLPDAAHGLSRSRLRLAARSGARLPRALGEAHPRLRPRDPHAGADGSRSELLRERDRRRRQAPSPRARLRQALHLYRRAARETARRRHRRLPLSSIAASTMIRSTSSAAARSS